MDNNAQCPIKGCLGKLLCFALPVFIFLFAAGYVVHHIWLMPIYQSTASLWRPMNEMENYFPWLIGYYAILSVLISAMFYKIKKVKMAACAATGELPDCKIGGKKCPIKFGICFGVIIGLLLGTVNAAAYIWQPIPGELAVKWFIAWLLEGIGAGIILALICHYKQQKCAMK